MHRRALQPDIIDPCSADHPVHQPPWMGRAERTDRTSPARDAVGCDDDIAPVGECGDVSARDGNSRHRDRPSAAIEDGCGHVRAVAGGDRLALGGDVDDNAAGVEQRTDSPCLSSRRARGPNLLRDRGRASPFRQRTVTSRGRETQRERRVRVVRDCGIVGDR